MKPLDSPHIDSLIDLALAEDLPTGDITSMLTVPEESTATANFLAKSEGVLCGTEVAKRVFRKIDGGVKVHFSSADGEALLPGAPFGTVTGNTRSILSGERIALNFLQRLSGIASYTRHVVDQAGTITVLDTRKTTPGWRILEKYATKTGGATNHRMHLGDLVMIKDNHIDAGGGDLAKILTDVQQRKPSGMKVEVEVRTLSELGQALDGGADIVMLDNMDNELVKQAVQMVQAHQASPLVEVSGGITAARAAELATLGVDAVSMGALTTQATNLDISLEVVL